MRRRQARSADPLAGLVLEDHEVAELQAADEARQAAAGRVRALDGEAQRLQANVAAVDADGVTRTAHRRETEAAHAAAAERGDVAAVEACASRLAAIASVDAAASARRATLAGRLDAIIGDELPRARREADAADQDWQRLIAASRGRAPRSVVNRLAVVEITVAAYAAGLAGGLGGPPDAVELADQIASIPAAVARRAVEEPDAFWRAVKALDRPVRVATEEAAPPPSEQLAPLSRVHEAAAQRAALAEGWQR